MRCVSDSCLHRNDDVRSGAMLRGYGFVVVRVSKGHTVWAARSDNSGAGRGRRIRCRRFSSDSARARYRRAVDWTGDSAAGRSCPRRQRPRNPASARATPRKRRRQGIIRAEQHLVAIQRIAEPILRATRRPGEIASHLGLVGQTACRLDGAGVGAPYPERAVVHVGKADAYERGEPARVGQFEIRIQKQIVRPQAPDALARLRQFAAERPRERRPRRIQNRRCLIGSRFAVEVLHLNAEPTEGTVAYSGAREHAPRTAECALPVVDRTVPATVQPSSSA